MDWQQLAADFHWLLQSPPLLHIPSQWQLPPDLMQHAPDLWSALYQRAPALADRVNAQAYKRLGHYYEALWQTLLQYHARYQLVAANIPIRDAQRTLGELDLIVWDQECARHEHWELAVKFYLGVGTHTADLNAWFGVNPEDRLQDKWQRLTQHQLPLLQRPETQAVLAKQGCAVTEQRLILQGRLFYPLGQAVEPPNGAHQQHGQGFWCDLAQFAHYFAAFPADWFVLTKSYWLANLTPDMKLPALSYDDLLTTLAQQTRPICVAGVWQAQEQVRGFIVPETWREKVESICRADKA